MKRITSVLATLILAATAVAMAEQTKGAPASNASVQWEKHKQREGDAPTLEFQAGTPMELNCELQADTYEQQKIGSHDTHCVASPGSPSAATNVRPILPQAASGDGDAVKDTERHQGPIFTRPGQTSFDTGHSKGPGRVQMQTTPGQHTFRPSDFRLTPPTDTQDTGDDDDDSDGNGNPH